MNLTPENLKGMSANAVADSTSNSCDLNTSITKIAMDNGMNASQVQRLVESTNQMAYLSKLASAEDRTFEFDVANYDDIMDNMIKPVSMEKAASKVRGMSPLTMVSAHFENPLEKVASDVTQMDSLSEADKLGALKKIASHTRARVDTLEGEQHGHLVKLANHRVIVMADPDALYKMATFDNAAEMTKLVFGHSKVASAQGHIWSEKSMDAVKCLSEDLHMMKAASEELRELGPKVTQAEGFLKKAFAGAIFNTAKATMGVAGKVASGVAGTAKQGAGAIKSAAPKAYNSTKKTVNTGLKATEAFEGSSEVAKGKKKNFNVWSSLRG